MILFYSLCGVGVVAVGLAFAELLGRKSRRPGISEKLIETSKGDNPALPGFGGAYLPPPPDDRPPH